MKVSIVTPTFNRENVLSRLYGMFAKQTYYDCELVILDDSPQPSVFFASLDDERVRYVHSSQRMSVGVKRNILAELSRGDVIVHFDDDDYYAPNYVEKMLGYLGSSDFVKLSAWYTYSQTHSLFAYWDLAMVAAQHYRIESGVPVEIFQPLAFPPDEMRAWSEKIIFGWGFCYVYRRDVWESHRFPELHHGEDSAFLYHLVSSGCNVRQVPDQDAIALVIRHAHDHSVVFPQYLLPHHLLPRIFGEAVMAFLEGA